MNLALIIGGVWLALMVVIGLALSLAGRKLNRHVPLPEDTEDTDRPGPGPGPDPSEPAE